MLLRAKTRIGAVVLGQGSPTPDCTASSRTANPSFHAANACLEQVPQVAASQAFERVSCLSDEFTASRLGHSQKSTGGIIGQVLQGAASSAFSNRLLNKAALRTKK